MPARAAREGVLCVASGQMTCSKRALVSVVAIAVGWSLMVVAYDEPHWFRQISGVVGALVVLGTVIWWPVSGRRARSAGDAPNAKANDA